jgi:hypothetical protein
LAGRHGFELVGGDTVRADRLTFSLTALGRVRGPVFKRSGARVGDALMVTGTLGDAAAGLALLEKRKGQGESGDVFSFETVSSSGTSVGVGSPVGEDRRGHGLFGFVGRFLAQRDSSRRGFRCGR